MRILRNICLVPLLVCLFHPVPSAFAQGGENRDAVVGFILKETQGRGCNIDLPGCNDEDLVVTGETDKGYYAYLTIFNANAAVGIAGVEVGIRYNGAPGAGLDVYDWQSCGTLDFASGGWPSSGGGIIVTWESNGSCQDEEPDGAGSGVTAIVGFAYVFAYGQDVLEVTRRTSVPNGKLAVADCNSAESELDPVEAAGTVAFSADGSQKGKLPCKTITVEQATWGAIKTVSGSN